jgi:hypothetical protein
MLIFDLCIRSHKHLLVEHRVFGIGVAGASVAAVRELALLLVLEYFVFNVWRHLRQLVLARQFSALRNSSRQVPPALQRALDLGHEGLLPQRNAQWCYCLF